MKNISCLLSVGLLFGLIACCQQTDDGDDAHDVILRWRLPPEVPLLYRASQSHHWEDIVHSEANITFEMAAQGELTIFRGKTAEATFRTGQKELKQLLAPLEKLSGQATEAAVLELVVTATFDELGKPSEPRKDYTSQLLGWYMGWGSNAFGLTFPERSLAIGDSWIDEQAVPPDHGLRQAVDYGPMRTEYRLINLEGDRRTIAVIEVRVAADARHDGKPLLSMSGTGRYRFDIESGYVIHAQHRADIKWEHHADSVIEIEVELVGRK